MRIAVTGYVSSQAGSVASANALLLQALLDRGWHITFFSKASFVDPRPVAGDRENFKFVDVDNRLADRTRARLAGIPLIGTLAGIIDASTYVRLLVRRIRECHSRQRFDLCLWLGDYSRGTVPGIPTVSFAQGPPGTDARSVINHFDEIRRLAGEKTAWKWRLMAHLRLSPFGLPRLSYSDHVIIGSRQSLTMLHELQGFPRNKISTLPYPIDLEMFQPGLKTVTDTTLRCLWLGRIIPRKRLDLFLAGAAKAIKQGTDLRLTIVGGVGFIPGYDTLIRHFPYPERLKWIPSLPREEVPKTISAHDVLLQPSEEENFGSSVAEAQACGIPVVVGATNGNADYLSSRDIKLGDYLPETLAAVLQDLSLRKQRDQGGNAAESRQLAEHLFSLESVTTQLVAILESAHHAYPTTDHGR